MPKHFKFQVRSRNTFVERDAVAMFNALVICRLPGEANIPEEQVHHAMFWKGAMDEFRDDWEIVGEPELPEWAREN